MVNDFKKGGMKSIKEKNISASVIPTKKGNPVIYYIIISGIAFLLYFPILNYEFTDHDDTVLIKDCYSFLKEPSNVFEIFSRGVYYSTHQLKLNGQYYRPILTLSFFVDTQTGDTHFWQFYLSNILFHITCCILLFYLLQKLKYEKFISLIISLIFAVHPALVQAVAWVPGRNDSLLTLFTLLSFIFFILYFEKKKIKFAILHFFFFFICLLTKETIIFLPVILYVFYVLKVNTENKFAAKSLKLKYFFIGWLVLSVVYFVLRKNVMQDIIGLPITYTLTNLFYNLPGLIQYIGKMFLPFQLNTSPLIQDTSFIFGIITIALIVFLLYKSKQKNNKNILFGFFWLLLFLFPALIRTSDKYEAILLEHRMYLPIFGFYIIILEIDFVKKNDIKNKFHKLLCVFIIGIYFILSINHRIDFKDAYHYCKSGFEGSPNNSLAHQSMGIYYQLNNNKEGAFKEYTKAISLNPSIMNARNNLGYLYMESGDSITAKKLFLEEIQFDETSYIAYYNLGRLTFNQRTYAEAEEYYKNALLIEPDNAVAENDLAACYSMQKKYEEAIKMCIKVLDKFPRYEFPLRNIKQIFSVWNDDAKIKYYKSILNKKGINY